MLFNAVRTFSSSILPRRNSTILRTISSICSKLFGSICSIPSTFKLFFCAQPAISSGVPNNTGQTTSLFFKSIAAFCTRGSHPSVNTIRTPFPWTFFSNSSIIITLTTSFLSKYSPKMLYLPQKQCELFLIVYL